MSMGRVVRKFGEHDSSKPSAWWSMAVFAGRKCTKMGLASPAKAKFAKSRHLCSKVMPLTSAGTRPIAMERNWALISSVGFTVDRLV